MNIHAMLGENGWEVYEGPMGEIDYALVEYGKKLRAQTGDVMVEICITQYGDEKQIHIYSFYKGGFSIQRWVKPKLNKAGY